MCRIAEHELEFFIVHPGGPFFQNKNEGVWSIPKGIPDENEQLLIAAQREFKEETGIEPIGPFYPLQTIKQKSGKIVHAWTFVGSWNPADGITCNSFKLEWPPRSGKFQDFPEQDKAAWMKYEEAIRHINPAQIPLLDEARELFRTNIN